MATSGICKDGQHEECNGKVVMGAPGPFSLEKCKCKCHKENEQRGTAQKFSRLRKGDKVTVALSLAGFTTREEETVLSNRKGVIEIDNGPGNDPTRFDHEGYLLVGGERDYAMRLEL